MDQELGSSGLSRRELIKRSAVVGGTMWIAPAIDALGASRAWAQEYPPPPVEVEGCFTGGGNIFETQDGQQTLLVTYGLGSIPCEAPADNTTTIQWHAEDATFMGDVLSSINCNDTDRDGCADSASGTITGTLTLGSGQGAVVEEGAVVVFTIVDGGEGLGNGDFVRFEVVGHGELTVESDQPGGNIMAHCECPDLNG